MPFPDLDLSINFKESNVGVQCMDLSTAPKEIDWNHLFDACILERQCPRRPRNFSMLSSKGSGSNELQEALESV